MKFILPMSCFALFSLRSLRFCAVLCLVIQLCLTLCDPMCCSPPTSLSMPPGKDTGEGCHALLQGDFLTQGSNPGLLHHWQILHHPSHQGSPRILEWMAYPFSRGSSWPRNRTGVSCIAGGFFIPWATRETQDSIWIQIIFTMSQLFIYAETDRKVK